MQNAMADSLAIAMASSSPATIILDNPVYDFKKKIATEVSYVNREADRGEEEVKEEKEAFDVVISNQEIIKSVYIDGNLNISINFFGMTHVLDVEKVHVSDPPPSLLIKSKIQHSKQIMFQKVQDI